MRILLVEDDPQIGAAIASALDDAGMAADWVTDGSTALASIEAGSFELILLDIGLPKKDGLSVLRTLRQKHISIPVIMITARDGVQDRIAGLDLGADDYLVKPFMIDELMARIRAVIRRHAGGAMPSLSNGDFTIEPASKSTSYKQLPLELSGKEYRLLHSLLLAPGRIYSRDELEEKVYGWDEEVNSNAIEFLIHSLRKKTDKGAIKNVRGLGWMVPKA
ncbi:response regulator transcription factor [Granulosicoccus sp.]|nr:response regulator transcription factor [Granulosicoccus sp.]MDB4224224.1 response regulator transcription factor [Granulosicoccus sp.]